MRHLSIPRRGQASVNPSALCAATTTTYDAPGDVTAVLEPDGSRTLTYSYDAAGRVTGMSDPDRGSETYAYDANGNLTQSVDARGT